MSCVCRWSRGPPRLKLFTFLRSKCQVVLLEVECRGSTVPHPLERGSKLEIRLLWPPCFPGTHIVEACQRQLKLWIRVISIPGCKHLPLFFPFVSLSGEKNHEWRKSTGPWIFSQIVMRKESFSPFFTNAATYTDYYRSSLAGGLVGRE